jgi:hypothetical protein
MIRYGSNIVELHQIQDIAKEQPATTLDEWWGKDRCLFSHVNESVHSRPEQHEPDAQNTVECVLILP